MANGVGGAAANLLTGSVNANTQAPTIDQSGVNSDLAQLQGTEGEQGQTLGLENQIAQGKGPSAADALLKSQTATAQAGAGALASSNSGANGAGAAKRDAIMAGANATQQMGGQAATARAGEQLGAIQGAAGIESGVAGEQLGAGGLQGGLATSQAQINQQNQQIQQQAQESNVKGGQNALQSIAGAASGALSFLDADFKEPAPPGSTDKNGAPPAHFTFREERGGPTHLPFMAIIDRTTGRARKLATEELTPSEHHQLYAPHAAGPLDSPQRKTAEMHDMSMGGGASPGYGAAAGGSMSPMGSLKEFSADATAYGKQGGAAGPAKGPGGAQFADADFTQDPKFAEMVRRAHPALYRAASTKEYGDAEAGGSDAASIVARTAPGDVPSNEDTVGFGSAPKGYGANLAKHPSGDKEKRSKGFQAEQDTANAAEDPDRAAFMQHEGEGHFMPPSEDAETVRKAYEAHTQSHGGIKNAIGGALAGFADPKSAGKALQARKPMQGPQMPGVQAPGVQGAAPAPASPPMQPVATYSDGEMDGYEPEPRPNYAAADEPEGLRPGTKDWMPEVHDDEEGNRVVGQTNGKDFKSPLAKTMGKAKPKRDEVVDDAGRYPEERDAIDRVNEEGKPENADKLSPEEANRHDAEANTLLRQAPDHLTRQGNEAKRKQNHPDVYMDAELGSEDNPVDIDAYEPGDAPQGVEDEALKWGHEPDKKHDAFIRAQAAEMAKLNPYLDVKPHAALAMMFPAKKAQKVGPTDWLTALHESNERYNRAGAVPFGDHGTDEAEDERHERSLNEGLGAADESGLVPGEAEGIDIGEARRRVKNRAAVHNLLEQWMAERKAPRHARVPRSAFADGEMGAPAKQEKSALASTMKRKGKAA